MTTAAFLPFLTLADESRDILGWKASHAKLWAGSTGLDVMPTDRENRPYISVTGVERSGEFTIRVKMKISQSGTVGVGWKGISQKDFPKKQVVYNLVKPRDDSQEFIIKVPIKIESDAFRLFVPFGDTIVEEIRMVGGGEEIRWVFVPESENLSR